MSHVRSRHILGIALATIAVVGINCSLSGVQNDCTNIAGSIRDGGGQGGEARNASGGGEGPVEQCLCPLPINFNPECVSMVMTVAGGCEGKPLPNFTPCRGGVGLCFGGICNAPDWPAACQQGPAGAPWVPCDDVGDCDDGNPCTSDSCPLPGCESCLHVPFADLSDCSTPGMGNQLCRQGACCDTPAGFNAP